MTTSDRAARVIHIVESTEAGVGRHVMDILQFGLDRGSTASELIYSPLRADGRFQARLEELRSMGLRAHPVPMTRRISPLHDARATLGIIRTLRKRRPHVVHTHSSKAGVLGRVAAAALRIPSVHTPNGLPWHSTDNPRVGKLYELAERVAGMASDCVIAVSQEEREEILERRIIGADRCLVVENALPRESMSPLDLKSRLGIPGSSLLVGAVGRVAYQKDPDLFIDIAERTLRSTGRHDLHFAWIGGGDELERVQRVVAERALDDRIHFIGPVDSAERFLESLDVYLLSSRYEGLSYALLEAMRAGRIVVAAAVAGTRSVLEGAGYVIGGRDPGEFAKVLATLAADDALRESGQRASRAAFESRFTLDRMMGQLSTIYDSLAIQRH